MMQPNTINTIQWTNKAIKQLRKIDKQHQRTVVQAVSVELVDLSQAQNVKALTNHEYGYRLRVGNYRVFFDFDGSIKIVTIEEVKKRDERTY